MYISQTEPFFSPLPRWGKPRLREALPSSSDEVWRSDIFSPSCPGPELQEEAPNLEGEALTPAGAEA